MASSRSPRRRVVLIASPGVQLLDLTGPLEAFAGAAQHRPGAYHWVVASPGGGAITSSSGVVVTTRALGGVRPTARDTVLIAGGDEAGVRGAISDRRLRAWLVRAAPVVERLGSVCSGAFVLAATGLLDGQREILLLGQIPASARLVLLRLADAALNYETFDLTAEVKR